MSKFQAIAAEFFFINPDHLQKKARKYDPVKKAYTLETVSKEYLRRLSCRYCKRTFRKAFGHMRHLKAVHEDQVRQDIDKVTSTSTRHPKYRREKWDDEDEDMDTDDEEETDDDDEDDEDEDEEEYDDSESEGDHFEVMTFDKETWKFLETLPEFQPKLLLLDDFSHAHPPVEKILREDRQPRLVLRDVLRHSRCPSGGPSQVSSPSACAPDVVQASPSVRQTLTEEDIMQIINCSGDESESEDLNDRSSSSSDSRDEPCKNSRVCRGCSVVMPDVLRPSVLSRVKREFGITVRRSSSSSSSSSSSTPDSKAIYQPNSNKEQEEEPLAPGPRLRERMSSGMSITSSPPSPPRIANRDLFKKLLPLSDEKSDCSSLFLNKSQ